MKSVIKKLQFGLFSAFVAAPLASTAIAEECDYVGRHFKTDLTPVAAQTFPSSRQGDIVLSPSLKLTLRNVGVNAITTPSGSVFPARQIAVRLKGQTLYGFIPTPVAPGAEAPVSVSFSEGLLGGCEETSVAIDVDDRVGQWGCGVHGNDALNFTAFWSRFCIIRPIFP